MNSLIEIYNEFEQNLMGRKKPSEYFIQKFEDRAISNMFPFTMLSKLKEIEQSPKHHPEGNVWNHTMQVVDNASKLKNQSSDSNVFMWSALLHDLGKVPTTKIRKGRITAYDHDKYGEDLSRTFLTTLGSTEEFAVKVSKMVRWHMQFLFVIKNLPFAEVEKMVSEVNIDDVALLSVCDRLGRDNMTKENISIEQENMQKFVKKCKRYVKS